MGESVLNIKVEGIDRAVKTLAELEYKARRRVATKAVRAGDNVILKEVKARTPKKSGALRKSTRQSIKLDQSSGIVRGKIVPGKATKSMQRKGQVPFYAHMVIGGTKPHEIATKNEDVLAFPGGFFRKVMHPGSKPNPYIEQAADAAANKAVEAFSKMFAEWMKWETAAEYKGI